MNRAQRRQLARTSRTARKRGEAPALPVGMAPDIVRQMEAAVGRHRAGDLIGAAALYRSVLDRFPDQGDALNFLGLIESEHGNVERSLELIDRSLKLDPRNAVYHNNRGNILQKIGATAEAIVAFRRAVQYAPDYAVAHNNLGLALDRQGDTADAEKSYRRAIAANSDYAEAYVNLGTCLYFQSRLDDAEAILREGIRIAPAQITLRVSLSKVLAASDRVEEAISLCREALEIDSCHPPTLQTLARLLESQRKYTEAEALHRKTLELDPQSPVPWNNIGRLLRATGRYTEGMAALRKGLEFGPTNSTAHSNLLFSLAFDPDVSPTDLLVEARKWNERHAAPLAPWGRHYANSREPERRLRIGYISRDLRDHPVATFLAPLYESHDRQKFEIYSYADIVNPDAQSAWFEKNSDCWRNIFGMPDSKVAQLVRDDRIDVLFDLAGHTSSHRLLAFAEAPAPVQVSWLGYGGTTGLDTIGWRITDAQTDPPGSESQYCERTYRLPHSLFCYRPDADAPPVTPLPAATADHVTFGSFNNLLKVNDRAIARWAEILSRVPASRMVIKGRGLDDPTLRSRFLDGFAAAGVDADRLDFVDYVEEKSSHLAQFSRVDIVLDTFPYSGATTTCEALWMGVPVVTMAGDRYVARMASGILESLGLDELVARDEADYVDRAVALAADLSRLVTFRNTLREKVAASPLCDGPAFAAAMEDAIRYMWRDWCCAENSHG